ncbi:hypothetical protein, partial [Hoeflea sp.]|uniref:hypothetical protein n=1 Tax=Hoeflea sp. TaxID=1940281 RepID=UPI003A95223B
EIVIVLAPLKKHGPKRSYTEDRTLSIKIKPRQCLVEEAPASFDPQITGVGDLRPQLFACLEAFFMAQPKQVQKPANDRAMHVNATPGEFDAQFVVRHFAIRSHKGSNPFAMRRQLTTRRMALPRRRKRTSGSMQDHHVVDKSRGHTEIPGRLPMAVAFFYKPNDTRTQFDRMRLAHGGSPSMGKVNHKSINQGNPDFKSRDTH